MGLARGKMVRYYRWNTGGRLPDFLAACSGQLTDVEGGKRISWNGHSRLLRTGDVIVEDGPGHIVLESPEGFDEKYDVVE
jgi:hypothetical protein